MDELIYFIQKFLTFIPVPFLALVNISITAGWIVLAVLLIRLLFRKAPKWFNCVLWGIVALRLIFPFSVESVFSLIPSTQTIEPDLPYLNEFKINSGIEPLDNAVNTQYSDFVPIAENTVDVTIILACVWLVGIAVMLVYAFASWAKLRRNLRTATKKEGNIFQSEFVKSPFVLGFIKPKIYIPYKTNENDLPLVIAHEQAHIKRLDHLIKPLGFLLLSVHWFNPLLWIAYVLLCRDIESACDEKVVKKLTNEQRKSYSTALLNASISRKSIAACPLAFGETSVKERIKEVMNYKKPVFWIVVVAVIICIISGVCFLTNPVDTENTDYSPDISPELDRNITLQIINRNQGYYLDGIISCEAHEILATQTEKGDKESGIDQIITVYLVSMYQEYSTEDGQIVECGGNITPLALSFVPHGEDGYALYKYWEPGMGSEYVKNLKAKFPPGVDYDTQTYVESLQSICDQEAREYFKADFAEDDTTEELTTTAIVETEKNTSVSYTPLKNEYSLRIVKSNSEGMTWLTNEAFYKANGYHVYLYCLDECYVMIGGKEYKINEALDSGMVTADAIVTKAKNDVLGGKAVSQMYKDGGSTVISYDDGGSTEYKAEGYAVIKKNTIDGNKDVFIGPRDMTLNQVNSFMEGVNIPIGNSTADNKPASKGDIIGVTADISPEAEPNLSGEIKEINGNQILIEITSDQNGIKAGSLVYVGLNTVLSYAPDIDSLNLKKGDHILVIYDGNVMETYPLQINAYAVYKAVT